MIWPKTLEMVNKSRSKKFKLSFVDCIEILSRENGCCGITAVDNWNNIALLYHFVDHPLGGINYRKWCLGVVAGEVVLTSIKSSTKLES